LGSGGDRLNYNQLSESELTLLQNYQPSIIYGRTKPAPPNNFVPATVAFDKQVSTEWQYGQIKLTLDET
jgi:hypothetical protein